MTTLLVAGGHKLVTWPPGNGSRCALELIVSGDVLVADATADGTAPMAVADVIYRDQPCARPLAWTGPRAAIPAAR